MNRKPSIATLRTLDAILQELAEAHERHANLSRLDREFRCSTSDYSKNHDSNANGLCEAIKIINRYFLTGGGIQ